LLYNFVFGLLQL